MTAAAQQPDELAVTIIARVGDKTYELGTCAVGRTEDAMVRLPALLHDVAIALIAEAAP